MNDSEMTMSATDIQRLVEIERRREARISVVTKGRQRQPRRRYVDESRVMKGSNSSLELAEKYSQPVEDAPPMEEVKTVRDAQPVEEVSIFSGLAQTQEDQPKVKSSITPPDGLDSKRTNLGLESDSSILESLLISALKCRISGDWSMTTQNWGPVCSSLTSNHRAPQYKLSNVVLPPTCTDLILRPKSVQPSPMCLSPDLGSSSKLVVSELVTDTFLQPKVNLLTPPPILGLGFSSPKIVLSISPPNLDFSFISPMKQTKLILPPTSSDIVAPKEASSPSWPPIDLTNPSFTTTTKVYPRIQAIQAQMVLQAQICKESKARAGKAAKALRNAWKHSDARYRGWLKARRQAAKALQIAGDRLDEMRREEDRIWAQIDRDEEYIG